MSLPKVGGLLMSLESWGLALGVASEFLETGAVCHSLPGPQHLVQCLGAPNYSQNEGKEEEKRDGGGPDALPCVGRKAATWGQDTGHPVSLMEQLALVPQA